MAKTSKAEKRSVEILKKIAKLAREYREVANSLDEVESPFSYHQALVIGIWCPDGDVALTALVGHSLLCDGIIARMDKSTKTPEVCSTSFSRLKKALKNA